MSNEAKHALKNYKKYKGEIKKSSDLTITLLTNIAKCLELKRKKFQVFSGATEDHIQTFWKAIGFSPMTTPQKKT